MQLNNEIEYALKEVNLLFPDLNIEEKFEKAEHISGIPFFMFKWWNEKNKKEAV